MSGWKISAMAPIDGSKHFSVLRPSPESRRWSSSAVRPTAAGSSRRPDPVTVISELMGKLSQLVFISLSHTAVGWRKRVVLVFKAVSVFNWQQF